MFQATLSDQHSEWHRIFGSYSTCPLDCGSGEIVQETFDADAEALAEGAHGIRCGCCKGRHASVATVKFCYEVKRDAEKFDRDQAALAEYLEEAGECEHGLSAGLCSGPGHYPPD